MFVDDRYITYSSPPHKRKIGRAIGIGAGVVLVLMFFSITSNYRMRKAAGYDPLPASSVGLPVAPLILLGIGLWIGWGQTRIDLRRGVAERRPLGVPWLVKRVRLRDAQRLFVGFYSAPRMVTTPNAGTVYKSTHNIQPRGMEFWFVRLEGEKMRAMSVVQRSYEEANALAQEVGERMGLPVSVQGKERV